MATRNQKAKIVFRNGKGEDARVTDKVAQIVFDFAHGEQITIDVATLPKEIVAAAAIRGIAEKVRDTYAGTPDSVHAAQAAHDIVAQLMDGEWLSAREGGTGVRSTMLLEALRVALEKAGKPFDEAAQRAKLYADSDATDDEKAQKAQLRKAVSQVPEVAVVLQRLKDEAAAKRAEKAPAVPGMSLGDLA